MLQVVNALLTQLDRLKEFENVIIMATSNITDAIGVCYIYLVLCIMFILRLYLIFCQMRLLSIELISSFILARLPKVPFMKY